MNQTIDILTKYTKKNKRIGIINVLTFLSLFIVFPSTLFFATTPEGGLIWWKALIMFAIIFVVYFAIFFNIIFHAEEKNLRKMLDTEKEAGTVIMYNPYLKSKRRDLFHEVLEDDTCNTLEEKKYFLFFHPYKDDMCTTVKYQITEELYKKYKKKIEDYHSDEMVPVSISSNSGLFENKFDYSTKNLDWDFLEY